MIDEPKAEIQGVSRIVDRDLDAIDQDLAVVCRVRAAEHLYECALAGAVLTEQNVDFAWFELEIDMLQGHNAREQLEDFAHFHD